MMRKNMKHLILSAMTMATLFLATACGSEAVATPVPSAVSTPVVTASPTPAPVPASLTMSAAASLKESMEVIKTNYGKVHPEVTITINYGASGSLQQQIEQGAPADIFFSAATKQMDALKTKGLMVDDTIRNLLENKIVLVGPQNTSLSGFADLSGDKVKKLALGEPKSVPVGQYAEEMLGKLNLLEGVKAKAVYGKDVKEVLTWVETGNADAGIVYATDARASGKVKVIAGAPEGSVSAVYYPVGVVKATRVPDAAKAFVQYLTTEGKPVFEQAGFSFIAK